MPFNPSDLEHNIYLEQLGTLAQRIDFAWEVYTNPEADKQHKKNAEKFLIYAFDIRDTQDVNNQLIALMDDRNLHKSQNPYYIPGKSPKFISQFLNPGERNLEDTADHNEETKQHISMARHQQVILRVNKESQREDVEQKTNLLSPEERAKYRVLIRNKLFLQNNKPFDTSNMISHGKRGYASFTLNANGELYLFEHKEGIDKMAHSSMTAGSPVVAAGEIKIENGVLKAITTHSGHYRPSLFNVHRVLEYFTHNDVDISQAKVVTFEKPTLEGVKSTAVQFWSDRGSFIRHETRADEIYKSIDRLLDGNIQAINKDIDAYKANPLTFIYKLKDKLTHSTLTEDRIGLALDFTRDLARLKTMGTNLTSAQLNNVVNSLDELISKYEKQNEGLAKGGRLSSKFSAFKQELQQLKTEHAEEANSMKLIK